MKSDLVAVAVCCVLCSLLTSSNVQGRPLKDRSSCSLPPVTGPCRALFDKWYYDKPSGECKKFVYGGCSGNENRFDTKDDCEKKCKPRSNTNDYNQDMNVNSLSDSSRRKRSSNSSQSDSNAGSNSQDFLSDPESIAQDPSVDKTDQNADKPVDIKMQPTNGGHKKPVADLPKRKGKMTKNEFASDGKLNSHGTKEPEDIKLQNLNDGKLNSHGTKDSKDIKLQNLNDGGKPGQDLYVSGKKREESNKRKPKLNKNVNAANKKGFKNTRTQSSQQSKKSVGHTDSKKKSIMKPDENDSRVPGQRSDQNQDAVQTTTNVEKERVPNKNISDGGQDRSGKGKASNVPAGGENLPVGDNRQNGNSFRPANQSGGQHAQNHIVMKKNKNMKPVNGKKKIKGTKLSGQKKVDTINDSGSNGSGKRIVTKNQKPSVDESSQQDKKPKKENKLTKKTTFKKTQSNLDTRNDTKNVKSAKLRDESKNDNEANKGSQNGGNDELLKMNENAQKGNQNDKIQSKEMKNKTGSEDGGPVNAQGNLRKFPQPVGNLVRNNSMLASPAPSAIKGKIFKTKLNISNPVSLSSTNKSNEAKTTASSEKTHIVENKREKSAITSATPTSAKTTAATPTSAYKTAKQVAGLDEKSTATMSSTVPSTTEPKFEFSGRSVKPNKLKATVLPTTKKDFSEENANKKLPQEDKSTSGVKEQTSHGGDNEDKTSVTNEDVSNNMNVIPSNSDRSGNGVRPGQRRIRPIGDEEIHTSSHFAAFFLSSIVAVFALYFIYHNRQKIVAIVIEGRSANPRRSTGYRKLETNVEEAMPTMKKYVA